MTENENFVSEEETPACANTTGVDDKEAANASSSEESVPFQNSHKPALPLRDDIQDLSRFDAIEKLIHLQWGLMRVHGIERDGRCTCGNPHSNVNSVAKHPVDGGWQTLPYVFTPDYFLSNSRYNVGVFCKSSGFFVIDVDPRSGGFESMEKFEALVEGHLPPTVEAQTGEYSHNGRVVRGRHLYYKVDGNETLVGNLRAAKLPGIDIKHNGYVLVPPSRHISGVDYEWKPGHAPWEMEIAEAPEELLAGLRSSKPPTTSSPFEIHHASSEELEVLLSGANGQSTHYGRRALEEELSDLRNSREGERNNTLYKVGLKVGSLIAGGHLNSENAIKSVIAAALETGLEKTEALQVLMRPGGALSVGVQNPREEEYQAWWTESAKNMTAELNPELVAKSQLFEMANLVDWGRLFAEDETPEDWYVPGVICAKRGHSIYSDAGLGKSLLLREMCAGLAAGKPVLGNAPRPEKLKVLYLDYENDPSGDIKKSLLDMGFGAADLGNLMLASYPQLGDFDTEMGGRRAIELVDELKPDLVVIDTVSRAVGGDENANDTWNNLYKHLGMHLKKREIAYVRLDHEGKNPSAGARGGSAKRGDVDIVWRYAKSGSDFILTLEKSRGPISADTVMIRRLPDPLRHEIVGTSSKSTPSIAVLYARTAKYREADELVDKIVHEKGFVPAQAPAWKEYRSHCKTRGISRQMLWDALKNKSETLTE